MTSASGFSVPRASTSLSPAPRSATIGRSSRPTGCRIRIHSSVSKVGRSTPRNLPSRSSAATAVGIVMVPYRRRRRSSSPAWWRYWIGETSQMTSGTLSVFAYLRFVQMKRRHSIVGELSEEHRDRKAGKAGGRSGRKAPDLEQLHGRRQPDLVAEPLGTQLQRHEHVIRKVEGDFSHESLPGCLVGLGFLAKMRGFSF